MFNEVRVYNGVTSFFPDVGFFLSNPAVNTNVPQTSVNLGAARLSAPWCVFSAAHYEVPVPLQSETHKAPNRLLELFLRVAPLYCLHYKF